MKLKVLKNTKGQPGRVIDLDYDGSKMTITEAKAKVDREDLPLL